MMFLTFEVVDKDLLGRIGKLKTKTRVIETPIFLPVINPLIQPLAPKEMKSEYKCQAIIANAYLLKKNFGEKVRRLGIHKFLEFDQAIMTDSGAYQILVYGDVAINPSEIAMFEEEINSDIAVILDVPTGWNASKQKARFTVEETLKRAKLTLSLLKKKDILWVGPIQGGNHLDLVAYSATEIGKMSFQIFALGSPTQVMERYLFSVLVDMIMTAKKNIPPEKPLHLFGAGHPFMFSFAVAMGCDIFDSAAYAIYARQDKYMTNYGTIKLRNIDYFPCLCSVCSKYSPKDIKDMPSKKREKLLAKHNLSICFAEIRRIKQAVREGRLWELLEIRGRSHPSLWNALKRLCRYQNIFEEYSPLSKSRGIFFFDHIGLARPQIFRHQIKLLKWEPPTKYKILVLLPQPNLKPFHKSREIKRVLKSVRKKNVEMSKVHFCVYAAPFGVIPIELDEIYPFSQFEMSHPIDFETRDYILRQIKNYIIKGNHKCKALVLYAEKNFFGKKLIKHCNETCSKIGIAFYPLEVEGKKWNKHSIDQLALTISLIMKNIKSNVGCKKPT